MKLRIIIGLETHVQLNTTTKLFCTCLNDYTPDDPNRNICQFCTGQPGALPRLNAEAVRKAITFGVAIGAQIPEFTRWDRKNYFYPDSPTGYQISQFDHPVVEGGVVPIVIENKGTGEFIQDKVDITRAHLEGDAAKLIHAGSKTMVDFNRCTAPLIEIVTEPCIHSKETAMAYVSDLQLLVRKLGISDADMEKGQMRFDVNISLQNADQEAAGELPPYRAEIKNINSIRSLGRSIDYEILRQTKILSKGETPVQETRGWDDDKGVSTSQRSKEESMDYRYFPEPDLMPLEVKPEDIPKLEELAETPWSQRQRYLDAGLSMQNANTFVTQEDTGELYDESIKLTNDKKVIKTIANIIVVNLLSETNEGEYKVTELMNARNVVELSKLFTKGDINNKGLSKAIKFLINNKELEAEEIVVTQGLMQVNDDSVLEQFVSVAIDANPKAIEDYKSGKENAIGFLVGQCMKESRGQGNPQKFKELILAKLS